MSRPVGSKNFPKEKETVNPYEGKMYCRMCRKYYAPSKFYETTNAFIDTSYKLSVCIPCCTKIYEYHYGILKDIKLALIETCRDLDIRFSLEAFSQCISHINSLKSSGHEAKSVFGYYKSKLGTLTKKNEQMEGMRFKDSDLIEQETINNNNQTESKKNEDVKWSDSDLQAKDDVIRLLTYDPFDGYSESDKKFLYNELLPYLDEDLLDDNFKLSQVIQIVNNNNQIRKIDLIINQLSSDAQLLTDKQSDINKLANTKKQIVDNNDKIAKENAISVKNRSNKRSGKGTLTDMMKMLREYGFEDAEQDYYDQLKCTAMKKVADISNQSILDQLKFDENDMHDIIVQQKELIAKQKNKILDLEEEKRQLNVKLSEK
jgi:hypothetical protein